MTVKILYSENADAYNTVIHDFVSGRYDALVFTNQHVIPRMFDIIVNINCHSTMSYLNNRIYTDDILLRINNRHNIDATRFDIVFLSNNYTKVFLKLSDDDKKMCENKSLPDIICFLRNYKPLSLFCRLRNFFLAFWV
jgi:hypothetical protein